MKTVPFFRWAEQTNYTNDGSGKPWRSGASPTKVLPPTYYGTEGLEPGERHAAQWENYVKNATSMALQDIRRSQASRWSRVQSTLAPGLSWNPLAKCWTQIEGTTLTLRDINGLSFRTGTVTAAPTTLSRSVSLPLASVLVPAGGGATDSRRVPHATTAGVYPVPTLSTPTSGTALVFGFGNFVQMPDFPAYGMITGTSGGVISILYVNDAAANWAAYAIPSGPAVFGGRGYFFVDPVDGSQYLIGSVGSSTSLYKKTGAGLPGTWTAVYNSTTLFGGATLSGPPMYDPALAQWVFICDATVARGTDATATRFRTSVYRANRATPQTVTLVKTIQGLGVLDVEDLSNGVGVGRSYRLWGTNSTPNHVAHTAICSTTDYGNSWHLTGSDIDSAAVVDTVSPGTQGFVQILQAPDSVLLSYNGNSGSGTSYLYALARPGSDLVTYT